MKIAALIVGALALCVLAVVGHALTISRTLNISVSSVQPQNIVNFIIDPDPTANSTRGDSLEKTVDYFTDSSKANPSVILGMGQTPSGTPGGLFLYTNDGSVTGVWTRHTILSSGHCYERTRAITFPGNAFPNVVASCNNQIILFTNPGNSGGNPATGTWTQTVLNSNAGAHQIRLADIDGDGKIDIICSASAILGDSPNYILYQNSPTSWQRVNGPGSLQDDLDVATINSQVAIIGAATDDSGVYWFGYPGSRTGAWTSHLLGAGTKGVAVSAGTKSGKAYVLVAANEDYPDPWPGGLVYYTQTPDPTQPWTSTTVDSTYRAVHEINTGTLGGNPYFVAAEEEQACINVGADYHGPPCHVAIFQFSSSGALTSRQLSGQGTQDQSVIPYQGGLLIVGANHHVYGGYPALQGWLVDTSIGATRSPDGTVVTAPATTQVLAQGHTWMFGSASTGGAAGNWQILSDGVHNGDGLTLQVQNGGNLYATQTQNLVYQNVAGTWNPIQTPDGTVVMVPDTATAVFVAGHSWRFGSAATGGDYNILVDGAVKGAAASMRILQGSMYAVASSGTDYQWNGTAFVQVSCLPGDPGCGGGGGGATAPAQATRAGFNILAANWDFSDPLYANNANWLECDQENPNLPWHHVGVGDRRISNGGLPCDIHQVTDPDGVDGKVLDISVNGNYRNTFNFLPDNGQNSIMTMMTANNNVDHVINFSNAYFEIISRTNENTGGPVAGTNPLWMWNTLQSQGLTGESNEMDVLEQWADQTSTWGEHNNTTGHNEIHNEVVPWPSGSSVDYTKYHKYGMRITDCSTPGCGGSQGDKALCGYLDDVFQGCTVNDVTPTQKPQAEYLIVWANDIYNSFAGDFHLYIKSIRVWNCSGNPPDTCYGQMLTNAP